MASRPRRDPLNVEPQVASARAATGEAFALAHEQGFGLDEVDHEVLLDALRDANHSLTALVWAMHPELDDLAEDQVDVAVAELVRRSRQAPTEDDPRTHMGDLLAEAIGVVELVRSRFTRYPKQPPRILAELDACMWYLATAMFFLDGDGLAKLMVDRPVARMMLGYAERLMDVAIAEQRIAVRERRAAG